MLATDWIYHAEGNNNIIFANVRNGHILRLPKITKRRTRPNDNARYHSTENHVISREMDFLENVVYRLMDNFSVSYKAEKRAVTPKFLRDLSSIMKVRRPENHNGGKLDESTTYGLFMPNYCRSLLQLPQNICSVQVLVEHPIISIEIRPKSCYIPVLRNISNHRLKGMCFFCMARTYLTLQGQKESQTNYCPFDLFSGNVARMKRALRDLIATPQRYFSVRVNDEPLSRKKQHFASENGKNSTGEEQKIKDFAEKVGPYFHEKDDELGLDILIDLLCEILRLPVTTDTRFKPAMTSRSHCRQSFNTPDSGGGQRMNNSLHPPATSTNTEQYNDVTHSTDDISVLDFLSSMQTMRNIPIDDVMDMERERTQYLLEHPEDCDLLSLDCPYNDDVWRNAANGTNIAKTNEKLKDKDGVLKIARTLRRFIIARGFSCCSVIISLQRTTCKDVNPSVKGTFYVNDQVGNKYVASIAMLDFYKETSNQILKYCKREVDVITFLNSNWN